MSLPFGNSNNGSHPMNSLGAGYLNPGSGNIISELTHVMNQNLLTNALQTQLASQYVPCNSQAFINPLIPLKPLVNLNPLQNQTNQSLLGPVPSLYTTQSVPLATSNQLLPSTYNQPAAALQSVEKAAEHPKQLPTEQPSTSSWTSQNMSQPVLPPQPTKASIPSKTLTQSGDGLLGEMPGGGTPTPTPQQNSALSAIILTPNNARHFNQHKIRSAIHSREVWHKVTIIQGAELDKEKVLKRILDFVLPTFMIPCLYQPECENSFFLVRNSGNSIERLCQRNLVIPPDSHHNQPIQLNIQLEYSKSNKIRINTSEILNRTLRKCLNDDMCLDLSNFHHDPDLERFMFFPLCQPIILHYVLSAAASRLGSVTSVVLSNNGLRTLKTLEILLKVSTLRSLDLRNNELLYRSDLKDLGCLSQLTRLSLDGNPVCAEFKTPRDYIRFVQSIIPNLEFLDGIAICFGSITQQNYIPNDKIAPLVDQFLQHYFNRYDWDNRNVLDGLYHPDVLFSITCTLLQNTSAYCSLSAYTPYNRNLLSLSDFSLTQKRMYRGSAAVLELLSSLPATSHDQYSFRVDLLQSSDLQVTFSVQGVFWEKMKEVRRNVDIRSFKRVFVILCTGRNEWQIVNEMLHISNATDKQISTAFRFTKPPLEEPTETSLWQGAELLKDTDKSRLVATLVQLSSMNINWAIRYLTEAKWNLREALINFVEQYESDKIPKQAFLGPKV